MIELNMIKRNAQSCSRNFCWKN